MRGAGAHLVVPCLDRVRMTVDLREMVASFPLRPLVTADRQEVGIGMELRWRVTDPARFAYEADNHLPALEQLARATQAEVVATLDLDQVLTLRDQLGDQLRRRLDQGARRWGVSVSQVALTSVVPSPYGPR